MLDTTSLTTKIRDRLSDTDSVLVFSDTELLRHITETVDEFSFYKPAYKTLTLALDGVTDHYLLPDDCITVVSAFDDTATAFTSWKQDDSYFVISDLTTTSAFAFLTLNYSGTHDNTGGSYLTIQTLLENDLLDLAEARCLDIMATDYSKRNTFSEAQAKIEQGDASMQWQRRASLLRWRVAMKYSGQVFGHVG